MSKLQNGQQIINKMQIIQPINRIVQYSNENNSQIVQGINNANQISNFDCEWIDEQQSPYKLDNNFPSDIQIGLDGINVGSRHHIQMNHVQFNLQNDLSINQYQQDQHFIKHKQNNQLEDNSVMSNHSYINKNNPNMLGDQLQLLNNSKDLNNIVLQQNHKQIDVFYQQNDMISQIQPSSDHYQIHQINQNKQITNQNHQNTTQNNQLSIDNSNHNQNSINPSIIQTPNKINLIDQWKCNLQNHQQTKQSVSDQLTKKQFSKSQSSIQKQQTITINQNSFLSKIYDDLSNIQLSKLLKSMAHYLKTNQDNYHPFYSLLQAIFSNSKTKSQKSVQNFKMYSDFFKQKSKQFQKYLRELQSQKTQKLFQNLKKKQINNLVYVDSKVVLRDIHERNIKKVKLYRIFYKQILEVSNQLKKIIGQVQDKRIQSEKSIFTLLSFIKSLQNDLQKLIEYRMNYQKHKQDPQFTINTKQLFKVDNPHIIKDHYLQIKFIIQKQTTYIKKLKQLRTQVIKYITIIFLTDQIILSAKIKQYLINYTDMLIQVEKIQRKLSNSQSNQPQQNKLDSDLQKIQNKKNILQQKKIHQELKVQLAMNLFQCIPQVLKQQLGIMQFDPSISSEQFLQLLNTHFQNQVFFPNIQLQDEFIFYKTEGGWLSRDQYKHLQLVKKISSPQKNYQDQSQIQTKNSLKFVLTINKYLHMEQNEKIATLKLNQIKISKKGKFIIISDRGKGIVGFLVNNGNQLGRIQLKSIEQADKFALKVKYLVQQK